MDAINFILLIIMFVNLGLGIFVISKNRKSKVNISFSFYAFFIAIWPLTLFFFRMTHNLSWAIFWMNSSYVAAICIAAWFWYFSCVFPEQKTISITHKVIFVCATLIAIIAMYIPNFFILSIKPTSWGKYVTQSWLGYIFFSAYFYTFYFGGIIRTLKKYVQYKGIVRMQLLYVIVSVTAGGSLGVFFNLILPSPFIREWRFIWTGPIFTLCVFIGIAYAVLKYNLMDIKLAVRRSTVFAFIVSIITLLYTLLIFFTTFVIQKYIPVNPIVFTGLLTGVLITLGFEPLKRFLEVSTDRVFFKDRYNPEEYLSSVSNKLGSSLDLNFIVSEVSRTFIDIFKVDKVAVLLWNKKKSNFSVEYNHGFDSLVTLSFSHDSSIVRYIQKTKQTLIRETLVRSVTENHSSVASKRFIQRLLERDIAIYVPLFNRDKLIGMFLLSEKKSGDMYSSTDIRVLEIVARQAATTFINAKLYQESRQFNVTLREKVDIAVHDLKKANDRLKVLDKEKSEFISIASHQLRTPLTIIKGYISMLLDGSFGKISKIEEDALEKVFISNERLIGLVEDLLNVSRIENKRMQYEFSEIDLADICSSVVNELMPNAKKKKLELTFTKKHAIPKLILDPEKVRQVILNLVDNSIKYTDKGYVHVVITKEETRVIIKVSDSGIGIRSTDIPKLFTKFSRIKEGVTHFTNGTGLGLFVAKKVVEAHKGKIWVESDGLGLGSTFIVEFDTTTKLEQPIVEMSSLPKN